GVPKGPALWGNPMPPRPEGSEWRSQILAEGRDVCSRPLEVCFMGGVLAPAACSTGIIISPSSGSVKRLLLLGHHLDMDLQGFIAAAEPDSADRAGLQVVAPDREPKVGRPGRPAVGDIEAAPSGAVDPGLGPRVGGDLRIGFGSGVEIAADVAGRDAENPAAGDEKMAVVLADAAPLRQHLAG